MHSNIPIYEFIYISIQVYETLKRDLFSIFPERQRASIDITYMCEHPGKDIYDRQSGITSYTHHLEALCHHYDMR